MARRGKHRNFRASPSLGRKRPSKELGTVHWVFCEGKTEKDCLEALRIEKRMAKQALRLVEGIGGPWRIVEEASRRQRQLRKGPGPSSVHVVFDCDDHPRFREAFQRARDLDLSIGVSVPCFELWAILLHQDQTASIDRHRAQRLLKELHAGYCHDEHPYLDSDLVRKGLHEAQRRSEHLAQ